MGQSGRRASVASRRTVQIARSGIAFASSGPDRSGQARCGPCALRSLPSRLPPGLLDSPTQHEPSSLPPPILPQNLARPPSGPSRTFHPGRRASPSPTPPSLRPRTLPRGGLADPVGSRAQKAPVGGTARPARGQEMGQAFRKLFDAFFGNKEMRVRCHLFRASPFRFPIQGTAKNRGVPR